MQCCERQRNEDNVNISSQQHIPIKLSLDQTMFLLVLFVPLVTGHVNVRYQSVKDMVRSTKPSIIYLHTIMAIFQRVYESTSISRTAVLESIGGCANLCTQLDTGYTWPSLVWCLISYFRM